MDNKDFLKIAVTVDYRYPSEASDIEKALSQKGFDYVHIRKPDASVEEIRRLIEEIKPEYRSRLTLHDAFPLAQLFGVGGVHLNKRNPNPPAGWNGRISASCHTIEESLCKTDLDYVTLSPIFPSFSKPGYHGNFELSALEKLLNSSKRPRIVALGGVTDSRIPHLRELGFDGAAMLSEAWRHPFTPNQFQLQFITHPSSADEAVRQTLDVLKGGGRWIQLRWKDASDEEFLEAARRIKPLCKEYNAIFLLNDRVHLAAECEPDGIHLGKTDMPVGEARKILGPGMIIGRTANTVEDLLEGIMSGADYIGMGPFRFTHTKKNLSPMLGIDGYRKAEEYLKANGFSIPIVAIGGIGIDDVTEILRTGVNGIAVSGTIISSSNPAMTTEKLIRTIEINK